MTRDQTAAAVHVARGASYIFLQGITTNLLMAATFAIVARVITTAEMGTMTVLLMITGAARIVACLGMPASVTRFIAEHSARNEQKTAAGVFYQALRTNLAISLPIAAAIFMLAPYLSTTLLATPDGTILFQILALDIIPTAGLLPILNNAMLGLQKIKQLSTINLTYMASRQTLIIILTLTTRSLRGLVTAWLISELGASLVLYAYVRSILGPATFTFNLKHLTKFSFPLFLQDLVNYFYGWFDRAILLAYSSLEMLGIYNASMTAFGVLANVPGAIATTLFPTYSAIKGKHGTETLQNSIRAASRYVCLIAMPLSLGLAATAKPALTLFVGEAYAEGTTPLIVTSSFFALTLISTAITGLLIVLGETTLSLKLTALNVAIGAASAQILLPLLGTTGAAITRGIVMVTTLLTTVAALRKKITLSFDREAFQKSLLASSIMAVTVTAIQAYSYSKFHLPIYVLAGAATYLIVLRLLRTIKPMDTQLLMDYLGPRFGFISEPISKLVSE